MSFLSPENQQEGTGLLSDVDVKFAEVRVVTWDYNGKVPSLVPALKVTMELEDGQMQDQYYSLGKATDWQPNEDGTQIVAVGKATGIANNSNSALLINSMVNAGFPENKITNDVRCFEGITAHVARVPAPKRGGAPKPPREDGKVYEDTVLVVETIISFPWDKKAASTAGKPKTGAAAATKAAPKAAPKAAAAAAAEVEDDNPIDSRCTEVLLEILGENPDGVGRSQLPGLALKKVAKEADKNAIVTRIFQEAFLNVEGQPWTFAGGRVTMA
jgi:hypothetical protein